MVTSQTLGGKCPRCGVMTEAIVVAQYGDKTVEMGKTTRQSFFCRCAGCHQVFLAEQYAHTPTFDKLLEDVENRNAGKPKHAKQWEKRYPVETVGAISGLPPDVDMFYVEAVTALLHGLPNAAGAVFRKTMEAVTLTEAVANQIPSDALGTYRTHSLYHRIVMLKDNEIIPKSLFTLADVLRLEGNVAVHDLNTYTIAEAEALKAFTDAFLQHVIVLPAMISNARSMVARNE